MDDLIYRQKAIATAHRVFDLGDTTDLNDLHYLMVEALEVLPSAEPVIRCKDCKYFEYDHMYVIQGLPIMGNLVCNKWGNGCRTKEDGFCFMAERRADDFEK